MSRRFAAIGGLRRMVRSAVNAIATLLDFGGNPLTVNNTVVDAITIAAPHDAVFLGGQWTCDTVPNFASTITTIRYIFAWDVNNYIAKWNSSGQYRLRLNGVSYDIFAITHSASDTVTFRFDSAGLVFGISVNGGAESTVAIPDVDFPDTLLYVGQGYLSNLPYDGDIYEPVAV